MRHLEGYESDGVRPKKDMDVPLMLGQVRSVLDGRENLYCRCPSSQHDVSHEEAALDVGEAIDDYEIEDAGILPVTTDVWGAARSSEEQRGTAQQKHT